MKTSRIFIFGLGIVFLLGISTATTYFCLKHFSAAPHASAPLGLSAAHDWAHRVDLSREQQEKLAPSEAALQKDLQNVQTKLAEERIALCRLIQDEPANSKKVAEYAQRVSTLEAEQQRLVINHLIVMRDILNPAQRGKFFSSIMHEICEGCRRMVPGQKCICGMCDMQGHLQ